MPLTDKAVSAASGTVKLSDGNGLYLRVSNSRKKWSYLYQLRGKRREKGLGGYPDVSLKDARRKAAAARAMVLDGKDPILEEARSATTLGSYGEAFIEGRKAQWTGQHTAAAWAWSMTYAKSIAHVNIANVNINHILTVLKPIWTTKNETARQLQWRLKMILDAATAEGLREGANPAAYKGPLETLLPRQKMKRGHQKALPYEKAPEFYQALTLLNAQSANVLRMIMLTAARSNMVLGMEWGEIEGDTWRVPASRMKARKEFLLPLSPQALELIQKQIPVSRLVFPGQSLDKPLSRTALSAKLDVTVHGFRSTFRDWAGDQTAYPWDIAEAALSHAVGGGAARAYRRGDALEKRRQLMVDWAKFLTDPPQGSDTPSSQISCQPSKLVEKEK